MVSVNCPAVNGTDVYHYQVTSEGMCRNYKFSTQAEENRWLNLLAAETSDRLVNWQEYLDESDAKFGSLWQVVMTAYCYPRGGDFSDDAVGIYYCAQSAALAIKQWSQAREQFWQEFAFYQQASLRLCCYRGCFSSALINLIDRDFSGLTHQQCIDFARQQKNQGAAGLLYSAFALQKIPSPSLIQRPDIDQWQAALFYPAATTPLESCAQYLCFYNGQYFDRYAELGQQQLI